MTLNLNDLKKNQLISCVHFMSIKGQQESLLHIVNIFFQIPRLAEQKLSEALLIALEEIFLKA